MKKKKAPIAIPTYKLTINLNECVKQIAEHFWEGQNHIVYTSWKELNGGKK